MKLRLALRDFTGGNVYDDFTAKLTVCTKIVISSPILCMLRCFYESKYSTSRIVGRYWQMWFEIKTHQAL